MSTERIRQGLLKVFERHRVVFWYDKKQELRKEFDAVELADIQKLELKNNEFAVKFRVLREEPTQKFLLYQEGQQPQDIDNWLLDVFLANGEFRTDQVAIWLAELGLGMEFAEVIQPHVEFFNAAKRREQLQSLIKPDDTPGKVRLKILAVCAGSEHRIDEIIESLLAELAERRDEKIRLIERCGLAEFLWDQLRRHYGYDSERPGMRDFVVQLFQSCYAMGTEGEVKLSTDALVFLRRWKDSRQHEAAFELLSDECADALRIEQDLDRHDFRRLVELDYFELIDQKILFDLVRSVTERTISPGDCAIYVRRRRQTHWYKEFQDLYQAVDYGAQFINLLDLSKLSAPSMQESILAYSESWFKFDQLYRKFICHARRSAQTSLLQKLVEMIENLYSNTFLTKVNESWQSLVNNCQKWEIPGVTLQRHFFQTWVRPILDKGNKVFVIVSDALRYEAGEELVTLMRQEDRFEATIQPALSMLPSYTQLGMAALLPNRSLMIAEDDTGTTKVDGQNSQGTDNRTTILSAATTQRAKAIRVEDLMNLNRDECRSLIKGHDVVYVYHNRIDSTGHKLPSEERAFEAVEDSFDDLIKAIKKLTNANANNVIITSDHGFIYQHRAIDESDFLAAEPSGDKILFRDRRFILGLGLQENPSLKKFSAAALGLEGQIEVLIPKSINRLRLRGSCTRFVHGGATLQEVVIPVIQINKKRQSDISSVEVEILKSSSSIITSSQLSVAFYQAEPVSEKVQPRKLRAGIYTDTNELISDRHELTFDLTSENPRERELQIRFVLTKQADEANGKEVSLRLEELVMDTSHYREYKSVKYVVRRSFTSDFDF
ncbi:BREX-1 system phosphatase PglZ type A [bacterium]|nr:BREX-1 system phosphatase PglZ type A [bacterium]QQR57763.1 MAG: BREX-1 system phosphatase PglZ type A [Candidatus Melainabacteria bacterium]